MTDQARVQQVIDKIVQVAKPEKIFLLGSLTTTLHCPNTFVENSDSSQNITHVNLLALTTWNGTRNQDMQDIIETKCRAIIPVTAMVMPVKKFNSLAIANNLFAKKVFYADLLYDAGSVELVAPALEGEIEDCLSESTSFACGGKGFLASAELLIERKDYKLAAFMLHQAFEQLCLAKIKLTIGIKPNTHNLDKLYRYIRCFTTELVTLFPRDTEKEERLFSLLKEAYIQARYSIAFTPSETDIHTAFDRINRFNNKAIQLDCP